MEKLNMLETRKCDLLHWAVINAVTKLGDLENIWVEFPKDGKWEFTLTMSGVELPIMETFKQIEACLDKAIKDKAKELINDHFADLFSVVEDTLDDMTGVMKEKIMELTEKNLNNS